MVEDRRIAPEHALPETIADDHHGMVAFARVVGVIEHAAHLGAHAESLEIRARDGVDTDQFRVLAIVDEAVNIVDQAEDGRSVREDGIFPLELAIKRI